MKRFKFKAVYTLLLSIIAVAIILLIIGFVLKRTTAKDNLVVQDMNSISVPLAAIQDDQLLSKNARKIDAVMDEEKKTTAEAETETIKKVDALVPKLPPLPKDPPKPHEVDISYFDDALFIGDSRTVGLYLYSPIGNAVYFASTGMSVFGARTSTGSDTGHSGSYLGDILASRTFGKIYVMLGVNECGYGIDALREKYAEFIDYLKGQMPDAKIIIMANLSITREFSNGSSYVTYNNLMEVNNMLSEFQDGETVFFLDVNPLFTDSDGYLIPEYTWDGVHPYADLYSDWSNFLILNGI